jgi:hypothetical protein
MDLDFGHGFVARIARDNYRAVDRCLGPGELWSEPLDLPWAIADGAWAEKEPSVLDPFRGHGTKLLIDTEAWRYRFPETFGVAKMTAATWTPDGPVELGDKASLGQLVRESLWAQAKLGADAYLVPGFHPANRAEDLRSSYDEILAVVEHFSDIPRSRSSSTSASTPKASTPAYASSRTCRHTSAGFTCKSRRSRPCTTARASSNASPTSTSKPSRARCRSWPDTPARSHRCCAPSVCTQPTPGWRRARRST